MEQAELVTSASELAIALVGIVLAWLGATARKWIKEKIENEKLESAMLRLESAVESGVREVSQVVVPIVRDSAADGKITKAEAIRLREAAQVAAWDRLSKGQRELLEEVFEPEQLTRIIGRLTEAAVQKIKSKE